MLHHHTPPIQHQQRRQQQHQHWYQQQATASVVAAVAAAGATGRAQDVTRIEPLVCLIFYFYFITLIFILGPLNVETAMAATAARARDNL